MTVPAGPSPLIEVSLDGGEWRALSTSPVTIGRVAASTLVVEHPDVSRQHAVLRYTGTGWLLEDLNSTNGTWVNHRRVSSAPLHGDTMIQLGHQPGSPRLRVRPRTAAAAQPQPPAFELPRADSPPVEALDAEVANAEPAYQAWPYPAPSTSFQPAIPDPGAPPPFQPPPAFPVANGGSPADSGAVAWPGPPVHDEPAPQPAAPYQFPAVPHPAPQPNPGPQPQQPYQYSQQPYPAPQQYPAPVPSSPQQRTHDATQVWMPGAPGGQGRAGPPIQAGPPVGPADSSGRITIGRSADNAIAVDDLMVSRHHAVVTVNPAGPMNGPAQAVVTDLGSVNGTFVDGHRLYGPMSLRPGSHIQIGSARLAFDGAAVRIVPPDDTVLRADQVTVVTSDRVTRLRAVDLAVKRGELVAVVGPSGAGKSTLLGVLTGTRAISGGQVILSGRSLRDSYDELRQLIGYVPQEDIVHPQLTPRQELRYAAELRMASDVSVAERAHLVGTVLHQLGLTEAADRQISKLSGGQRKRTNVALELLTKPPIMFLDEPTSGLDPGHDKSLMQQLRVLANDSRAVLVVTHNVAHLDVCDRVLVLAPGGRTAYLGSPRDTLAAFGASDFAEVFQALEADVNREWQVQPPPSQLPAVPHASTMPPIQRTAHTWTQRFSVLTRRYLAIIAADRRNLALLLAQAPLLGLLIRAIGSPDGLGADQSQHPGTARGVMFTLVLSATWLGASNAIREIVKERSIYARERLIGVPIGAYLASKVTLLAALTLVQSIVLILVALAGRPGPSNPALLGSGWLELLVDVWMSGLAAVCFGLLISAAVMKPDKAMTLLPLLLVPQFVLCGGVLNLKNTPALKPISYLFSSRWGFGAAAVTIDMRDMEVSVARTNAEKLARANAAKSGRPIPPDQPVDIGDNEGVDNVIANDDDPLWSPTAAAWFGDIMVLVLMSGLTLSGAWYCLSRAEKKLTR